MTHQIVITRAQDGGLRVIEQGLGESGFGETLREHDLQPAISAEMAGRYIAQRLADLVAVKQ